MFLLERLRAFFHSFLRSDPPKRPPKVVEDLEPERIFPPRLAFHLNYDPDDLTSVCNIEHAGREIRDPLWRNESHAVGGWTHLLEQGELDQHSPAVRDLVRQLAEYEQRH